MFLGIENVIGGVIDVMKESTSIGSFKEDIEKLVTDVTNGLAIPAEQKDQVTSEIRQDIKETGTSSVNSKYQKCHEKQRHQRFKKTRFVIIRRTTENSLSRAGFELASSVSRPPLYQLRYRAKF